MENPTAVDYLEPGQVDEILKETGLDKSELPRYRRTLVGSDVLFWDMLQMYNRAGYLEERGNRLFLRESLAS